MVLNQAYRVIVYDWDFGGPPKHMHGGEGLLYFTYVSGASYIYIFVYVYSGTLQMLDPTHIPRVGN